MGARELLDQGQLGAAIEAATKEVKAAATNTRARIFLFELLAAAGEWERAQKQLDVVADQSPDMAEGIGSYRGACAAEQARARLFTDGQGAPQRMSADPLDPEPSLTALHRLRAGAGAEAGQLLTGAADLRPPRGGNVDGKPFDDFRDADDLLAPFLEVIANGLYGWIPFEQITKLEFEPPRFLRDLLWRPTTITLLSGASSSMLVPVRYPGSEKSADDAIRLGRSTDWHEAGPVVTGLGQRVFMAGEDSYAILEAREIVFGA